MMIELYQEVESAILYCIYIFFSENHFAIFLGGPYMIDTMVGRHAYYTYLVFLIGILMV